MNILKKSAFSFALCVSLVSVIGSASAMEVEQEQDTVAIKKILIQFVERAFEFPETNRFERLENGNGIASDGCGFVYFPKTLESQDDFINFIGEAKVPRTKMTLKNYIYSMRNMNSDITMIAGSGLVQAAIQPTNNEFDNPFFVDASNLLHPDIVSKLDLDFAYRDDVIDYHGTFDAIYLDNFPGMFKEEVLQAAALMLKPNGKLMMTYRRNSVLLDENHNACINGLAMTRQLPDILKDIELPPLLNHIEKCGFKNAGHLEDRYEIRPYGFCPYVLYGYKI